MMIFADTPLFAKSIPCSYLNNIQKQKREKMENGKWNQQYLKTVLNQRQKHSLILEKQIKHLSPGKALDLASGEGRNSLYLAKQGWKVTAVDFSEAAVKNGRELAKRQGLTINWKVADLTAYIPDRESFDFVCLFYLHMPKEPFRRVLNNAAAALRPGGTFLVVGHDLSNLTEGVGGPQNPEILYTHRDITAILDFMEIEYAGKERNIGDHGNSGKGKTQIDCVIRAKKPLK